MSSPKMSIVIPVARTEAYLDQCLRSVVQQTFQNIEIICVNDSTTNDSWPIAEKYAAEDARIRLVSEPNKSPLMAQKTAVEVASGEYILFLNAADYLEIDTCERLVMQITNEKVDILHFAGRVVTGEGYDAKKLALLEKQLQPFRKKLAGSDVFVLGFAQKQFTGMLGGKLYKAEVCKKAYSEFQNTELGAGGDMYVLCAMAYYARSYFGMDTEPLYHHRVAMSGAGFSEMTLCEFAHRCAYANTIHAMAKFSQLHGVQDQLRPFLKELGNNWLVECCNVWYTELLKEDLAQGWILMCKFWGSEPVVSHIAKYHFEERQIIAKKLEQYPRLRLAEKPVKTVGIYYHRMYSGGVERVISVLSPMLLKMGYKVVVFTDEPPTDRDYPIPEAVSREVIFSNLETDWKNVDVRFASITEVLQKHHVDVVLYNAWMSNLLLWDMLHMKGLGIPVIVHAHGVFSCTMAEFGELFAELPPVMRLADGIVTLSEVDKYFWDSFCDNVHFIPNPASESLHNTNSGSWDNKTVIWVGRCNPEKQPEKIFDIMERVLRRVPDAKLSVLGNFDDPKWTKLVKSKGIEYSVVFHGMVSNVNDYLEKASVFTCTSQFEGFPMSLIEAQAHRLPTVMFRLPHITMGTADRGVVNVDMDDVTSAANEIAKLLQDRAHWEHNSALAYNSFLWLRDYDMEGAWGQLLCGSVPESTRNDQVVNMVNTMVDHYALGCRNQESKNALIWFLQKAIGGIACCMENGFVYTVRLGLRKIRKRFG